MIIATGQTFDHRDTMKLLGGWWNNADRRWQFDKLSDRDLARLRSLTGVIVSDISEREEPKPGRMSRIDFDAWLAAALAADDEDEPWENEERLFVGNDETYRYHFAASDPIVFFGFDSLNAFIDYVVTVPRPGPPFDRGWTGEAEFTATHSMEEAVAIGRNGWLDALGASSLLDTPSPLARRPVRAVAGGRVNVPRMLSGTPDHMVRRAKQPANKVITLFVETVSWLGIKHDVLLIRAIAVCALVDRLEMAGYRCNIVAVYSFLRDDHAPMQLAVRLKEAGERLNIIDISFAFGHPSFGRRLVYAATSMAKCRISSDPTISRGIVSQAFNQDHQPGPNEYYIKHTGRINSTDIFDILEIIQPDNLPIKIERN